MSHTGTPTSCASPAHGREKDCKRAQDWYEMTHSECGAQYPSPLNWPILDRAPPWPFFGLGLQIDVHFCSGCVLNCRSATSTGAKAWFPTGLKPPPEKMEILSSIDPTDTFPQDPSVTAAHGTAAPFPGLQLSVSDDFTGLEPQWRALETHATDPFCGFAWCSSWYRAMSRAEGQVPYIIQGHDSDGELHLLMPLVREKRMGLRVLSRPARSISGDYGVLMSPELRRSCAKGESSKLWQEIARSLRGADLLILNGVSAESDSFLTRLPHLPASAPGFSMRLLENWQQQYEELFSAKVRRNDRRSLKRLHEEGEVEFVRPSEQEKQEEMLELLIEQKRAQIEASGEQHHLSCPHALKFYHLLPAAFAESPGQRLVLTGLSLNGRLIATSCGITTPQRYSGLFMAMDGGSSRKFSPGRLLLLDINRQLCEDGIRIHEFGNGDYQYKKTWKCDRHERLTVAAPTSFLGKLSLPLVRRALERRRSLLSSPGESKSPSSES